ACICCWLREFRVRPTWDGSTLRPPPPIHEKGLVTFDGVRKPAFFDAQRIYRGTAQIGPAPASYPKLSVRAGRHRPATISRRPWPRNRRSSPSAPASPEARAPP